MKKKRDELYMLMGCYKDALAPKRIAVIYVPGTLAGRRSGREHFVFLFDCWGFLSGRPAAFADSIVGRRRRSCARGANGRKDAIRRGRRGALDSICECLR